MRLKVKGAAYAACINHALVALDEMNGKVVKVRRVTNDERYKCHCGALADFFLVEYEDG